ncbi:MAG: EamA family transporter [Gammaproteobacteria bacterium]|nr:MAG: EamA family transporter [Gammaproteobacteria bacterium]PCJ19250.1 MAG: EamA family transporter [Gammaproteobacteria bacterium]
MILSALAFSVMSLFVKAVGQKNIPVLEIVAARSVVSLIISYIALKRQGIAPLGQRKILLFARGLIGFLALNCVFYAITHLPLAQATVLQYLHPMFTAGLAVFFLKERPSSATLICIGLSFLGLLMVVQPEFLFSNSASADQQFAMSIAVMGAFGSASAYVLVRKLGRTEHPLVIVMYFPLVSLPISVLLLWEDFVMPEGITWLYLLAIGVTTQVGQVALTKAMQTETASRATSFAYLQVVFAMILGIIFYQEFPNLGTLIGAGLIIGGAYISATKQR